MRIIHLSFFLFCVKGLAICQDVPEPDFSQRPFFIVGGNLVYLERVDGIIELKGKAMGYGGVEMTYSADGLKSSVRTKGENMKFFIKIEDNSDPSESFVLCPAVVKKSARKFKAVKLNMMGKPVPESTAHLIYFKSKKVKDKIFELWTESPLPSGEYALLPSTNSTINANTSFVKINCFGVD